MSPCSPWPSPSRTARGSPHSRLPRQRVALMAVGPGRDSGALPGPHPHDVANAFPVSADVLELICPESSSPGAAAEGSRPALAGTAAPSRVPWDHLLGTSAWGHCTESWGHPWRGPASREGRDTHGIKANTRSRDPAAPSTTPSGAEPRGCSAPPRPHLLPPSTIPSQSPAAAAPSARGHAPTCRALLWELAASVPAGCPLSCPLPFPTLPGTHGSDELGQDPGSGGTPLRPPAAVGDTFSSLPSEVARAGSGRGRARRCASLAKRRPMGSRGARNPISARTRAANTACSSPFRSRLLSSGILSQDLPAGAPAGSSTPKAGRRRGLRVSPPQVLPSPCASSCDGCPG